MKAAFNFESGIESLRTEDVRRAVSDIISQRRYEEESGDADNMMFQSNSKYARVMEELLDDPEMFEAVRSRLIQLNLNSEIAFLDCGYESMVFNLGRPGSPYLMRLARSYNKSFNLSNEGMPSPMITPIYHERIGGIGRHGVRMMLVPNLAEYRVPNAVYYRDKNAAAMHSLGFRMNDERWQNFRYIKGDPEMTPFCIDFGVYERDPSIPVLDDPAYTAEWAGKLERYFPVLTLATPEERLAAAVRQCGVRLSHAELREGVVEGPGITIFN